MKQILCFGDSNTWGLIPKTSERFPWGIRWTSILSEKLGQEHLNENGHRSLAKAIYKKVTEII